MLIRRPDDIPSSEITPESVYQNRRQFMGTAGALALGTALTPSALQALAATGMDAGQLIAQAFGGIAERAQSIGQLNVSPDLLQTLMRAPAQAESSHGR